MIPKSFEMAVVGNKLTITPYSPKPDTGTIRYRIQVRTWSPLSSTSYVANDSDLLKLRDWINSALIAKHARILGDSNEQQADQS